MGRDTQIGARIISSLAVLSLLSVMPAARAAPAPMSPSCLFDISVLPTVTARIKAVYPDISGGAGNIILTDGREVILPGGSDILGVSLTPGQNITVKGLISEKYKMISAFAVSTGELWVCASGHMPALALTQSQHRDGRIVRLLHSGQGDVGGVVLDSGVTIRFPPQFLGGNKLRVGDTLSISGRGFNARSGPLLIAEKIGEKGAILYQIETESSVPSGAPPGSTGYDRIESDEIDHLLP